MPVVVLYNRAVYTGLCTQASGDGVADGRAATLLFWGVQSISRGRASRFSNILGAAMSMSRLFSGQAQRADVEAIVASGLFEECASGVACVAAADADELGDVNHGALFAALGILRNCRQHPGAEAKIRSLAPALRWCLEHDLDYMEQLGITTAAYAAQICASLHAQK